MSTNEANRSPRTPRTPIQSVGSVCDANPISRISQDVAAENGQSAKVISTPSTSDKILCKKVIFLYCYIDYSE